MSVLTVKEESLVALGDAIRSKVGKSEPLVFPTEMVEAIDGIKAGPTEDDLIFTGDISYLFYNGHFMDWQDRFPFVLKDITKAEKTFREVPSSYDLSNITITTKEYSNVNDGAYVYGLFENSKTSTLPTINGRIALFNQNPFYGCSYITDDKVRKFLFNPNLEFAWRSSSSGGSSNVGLSGMFYYCQSLRNINDILMYIHQYFRDNPITYSFNLTDYYAMAFYCCYSLDEICNIPVFEFPKHGGNTSNMFNALCDSCSRAKNVMFATDNGTPYIRKWKSQTVDMSYRVGWVMGYQSSIANYNSGITADKEVKDDATYAALKNDPDWFTTKVEYSRYNHDSAVNTINSLPDTSAYLATAGGTNTIKFKGAAGSKTDGGAINTLTDAEIAVAAAKGWTVSLV